MTRNLYRVVLKYLGFLLLTIIVLTLIVEAIFRFGLRQSTITRISKVINNEMASEVHFSNVSFSVIENFPDATLNIFDVAVVEQGYQIFQLAELEIQFDPIDWFRESILFEKIELWNGELYVPIDSLGNKFMIQSKSNPNAPAAALDFDIPEIEINDLTIRAANEFKQNMMLLVIDSGLFELKALPDIVSLTGNAWGQLDTMITKGEVGMTDKQLATLDATIRFNTLDNRKIFNGTMQLLDANLQADGVITPTGNGNLLDITLQTDRGNLDKWAALFPLADLGLNQRNPDAYLSLKIKNTGYVDPFSFPFLDVEFEFYEAAFTSDQLPDTLQNVNIKGSFSNGENAHPETSSFVIDSGNFEMGNSFLHVNGSLRNFEDPYISWNLETQLILDEIMPLAELPNIKNAKGTATAKMILDGRMSELESSSRKGIRKFDGSITFDQISLEMIEPKYTLSNLSGKIELNNEQIAMSALTGKVNGSNFSIDGRLANFLPLLSDKPDRIAKGDLNIFLEDLEIPQTRQKAGQPDTLTTSIPTMPANLAVDLNFTSNSIAYDKYKIADLGAKIFLDEDSISLRQMKFAFGEGRVNLTGLVRQREGRISKIRAWLDAEFQHLDLDQLMAEANDTLLQTNQSYKKQSMPTIEISASIDADRLTYLGHHFDQVDLEANYADNSLDVGKLNFGFPYGRIQSKFNWINHEESKWLNGSLGLDLNDFEIDSLKNYFLSFENSDSTDATSEKKPFYDSMDIALTLAAKSIHHKGILARNVDGQLRVINGEVLLDHLNTQIFRGNLSVSGRLREDSLEHRTLVANLTASDFDLGALVAQFNDPNKDLFTQESFNGKLDLNGRVVLNYDQDLQHKSRDMIGKVHIALRDAQLKDLAPIKESLKFIKKENRENIYMANQQMTVLFHNEEMIIPKTIFESSISNIEFFGYHSLEFDFGFDMKVSVSDLLFRSRDKKIKNLQGEHKAQVKGLNYYLSARTEAGKMKIHSMKKKVYRNDLKRLEQHYVKVDSILNVTYDKAQ